ncbi:MAG: class I SAM-dependent methyltransferase [Luteimonas sp.]
MPNFNDYSTSEYGKMIQDRRRTQPFVEALRAAVRPDSVVLDIGAGPGIFSFLASQFGAARVYAVESDAAAIEVARRCASNIAGSDRITWIQGLSTELELPEQVDIVIGDLHGTLPFFKGNIESMIDARKRHLKPGGRMIPLRDVLYAAPAQAAHEYEHVEAPWRRNEYGIDLSAAAPHVVNQWWRASPEPVAAQSLLASPQVWGEVDYTLTESTDLDKQLEWGIERAGTLHGLYVWFDGNPGEGIGYSNSPLLPELVYGRAFFPLEQAIDVTIGDRLHTRLAVRRVKGDYIYRWDTRITAADGSAKAQFRQSTFKAGLTTLVVLRKASADYLPELTAEGQIAHAVLQAMAEGQRLQDIANAVAMRFPDRFRTPDAALDAVSLLAQKYG